VDKYVRALSDDFFGGVPGIGDGAGVDELDFSVLNYENGAEGTFRHDFVEFFDFRELATRFRFRTLLLGFYNFSGAFSFTIIIIFHDLYSASSSWYIS